MEGNPEKDTAGCLVLILLVVMLDGFGVALSHAGPYCPVVFALGLVGFASGAAVGAYVSVKIKQKRWWASGRWVLYGLIGMCLLAFISVALLSRAP